MKKVVINSCHGGFGLSHEAVVRYAELKGFDLEIRPEVSSLVPYSYYLNGEYFYDRAIDRDDPFLIQVVEELGKLANDRFSDLKIVEIPDDVQWYIEEYDGVEHVSEVHRIWD